MAALEALDYRGGNRAALAATIPMLAGHPAQVALRVAVSRETDLAVLQVNPGVALEIGELRPGEGGFSVAGTRDGAAAIENNDIAGLVSFYGAGTPERTFDTDALRRLDELLKARASRLRGFDLASVVDDVQLQGHHAGIGGIDALDDGIEVAALGAERTG